MNPAPESGGPGIPPVGSGSGGPGVPPAGSPPTAVDEEAIFAPAKAVDVYMEKALDERSMPSNLRDAARYSLLAPGKRLRPILALRACQAVGGDLEDALPAAAAIEMIHCFSLIHDDLPALDNDDLRRGRPTLHKHAGEAMAILAGDLLLGIAFEVAGTRLRPPKLAASVTAELALAANDMIVGQVYDTLPQFPPALTALERLQTIHRHKTGALIRAACRMGAICGKAWARQLEAISRYGDAIGLMFQIIDDVLDVTQTTADLGKTAGKDQAKGKLTYPGVLGIDASRAEVERLRTVALEALGPFDEEAEPLRNLCNYMAARRK